MTNTHIDFMQEAINISHEKMNAGVGGPFGAVIVKNNEVISRGWNKVTSHNDPTAHAEIDAIRKACTTTSSFNLESCTIYTSCEPCPMCLAAIYWARITNIYYGNNRHDAANIGFDDSFIYNEINKPITQRKLPMKQICHTNSLEVFKSWENKLDKIRY